jgi:putative tricarboxylic transport membrane protein
MPLLTRDRLAGAILFMLGLAAAWEARKLPLGSLADPGPGYWPLLIAVVLAVSGLLVALPGNSAVAVRAMAWPEARHALLIIAGAAAAALLLERMGYRLTVFGLAVFFLGVVERKPPVSALAVSLGLAFGSFYLFSTLLKVPLPPGPWGL